MIFRHCCHERKEITFTNYLTVSFADLESDFSHESLGAKNITPYATPVSIHVHSRRKRLCDADGISAKAVIDGLVSAGILQDDSPNYVNAVSYSQEKSQIEETIITIWMEQ